jgi:aconitate decarboxylase
MTFNDMRNNAKADTGSPTRALADFVADLRFADLPSTVVEHAKLCLLDTIGCALFGSTLEWSRILTATLGDVDADAGATVWGTTKRLSGPTAQPRTDSSWTTCIENRSFIPARS